MISETFYLFGFKGVMFLWCLAGITLVNQWLAKGPTRHYVFSFLVGSVISVIIMGFAHAMSAPLFKENPFMIGLGIVVIIGMWKFLFGPWPPNIKASVLGTFVFWIAIDILQKHSDSERMAAALATLVAFIPAVIWCILFLREHRARISIVALTFLAGMLSTAPILFYDHVVRKGYELHFFLFRIVPENFMRSSETFVLQSITGHKGVVSTSIAVTIVSFILVAIIEEWSKHWVTRKSDISFFSSVNDVMALSIIAAIGFAFAENIINPNYFIGFVRDYLVVPAHPQWGMFLGSVFGRSIITNMVHIVSSGVLGYYYGLAFFAQPLLAEKRVRHSWIGAWMHRVLQLRPTTVYRDEKMVEGLLLACIIHGAFNVITSLPAVLPGNPQTIGQMMGYEGPLAGMSIIAIPAVVYVFGGWILLTYLFRRTDDVQNFGRKTGDEVFVSEPLTA